MEKKTGRKIKGPMIEKKNECYCKTLVTKFLNCIDYFLSMYSILTNIDTFNL